ncbi:phytanoyl-CoA dioxygenase family protein [Paraferrimonas sedimenticola]|uniref:Phytanoyl-CoA dioxygenase n=1 Tax=Paraferrimonas sedimenticola TaxID=375674 RepID=A0AA37RW80_9GAMM|nr:phytanoyl-CoA dioxygenase family protein [Paraferrimonas sedimenticola]GLP95902.1 hypothetical protein GCM10007895_12080 [Paraferrimonas sedimenticola]
MSGHIAQLAQQFWQQGYLVLDGFFEPELMDSYQKLIMDYFGEDPQFFHNQEFLDKSKTEVIPWFPQREGVAEFDIVDQHPLFRALTQAILGEGWNSQYSMVMFSRKGTSGQAWHQDCPPEDPAQFNINRLVYTMDIDPQVGGQTLVVPGSHRKGALPASEADMAFPEQVVLTPRKGTLVLLHGHTWHKVTPVTGDYRVSTNYRAAPKGVPDDITDICVYPNMRYRFSTQEVIEHRV